DRNGVEFLGDPAGVFNFAGNKLTQILEMDMPRDELGEGIGHRYDGLAKIGILHSGRAPEAPGPCHVPAVGRCARAILRHGSAPSWSPPRIGGLPPPITPAPGLMPES